MGRQGEKGQDLFVKLDNRMTESAAWTAISDKAIWLYIELRKSFNFKNGGNDHLTLPYSKVSWRMNIATYTKRMRELVAYGFIRIKEPGGLPKRATVYALIDDWEEKSREIVDKEGREAISSGAAKKPSFKNNLKNLKDKRIWEHQR